MGSEELVQANTCATDSSEKVTRAAEWLPIETAPHEIPVLLFCVANGMTWQEVGCASMGRQWKLAHGTYSNISHHGYATHWMPLPLAPGAEVTFSNEAVSDAGSLNQTTSLPPTSSQEGQNP